jgi:hypothetical protein
VCFAQYIFTLPFTLANLLFSFELKHARQRLAVTVNYSRAASVLSRLATRQLHTKHIKQTMSITSDASAHQQVIGGFKLRLCLYLLLILQLNLHSPSVATIHLFSFHPNSYSFPIFDKNELV